LTRIYNILLLVALLSFSSIQSQNHLFGKVTDSVSEPLSGANMIAIPVSDKLSMEFSITDEQGRYRLNLENDSTYVLELSYLGYQKISDTLKLQEDISRNFKMQSSKESLDEILIKQKMAVLVREDTITYRTEVFKTGEERKLREVLKKLPGVEVDRDGNVTVNGKKVDKLMVDGKTFFTGDTKLAVENIPADAVDEVEVLDNYSEVPFLKGLEDSDKMAMNIKLSEGKKKFVFGDVEAGGGPEERYVIHPTLFYYSPKTSLNVIGDFNNIGERSFSMQDYINFEGGILALMDNPGGFNIYNDDFARFLRNDDFVYSKNEFGAFNIVQQITDNLDVNAYTIASKNKMEMLQENEITYLNSNGLDEFRETQNNNNLFFSLNKLQLRFVPNAEEDLTYDAFVKTSRADGLEQITSETPQKTTFVNTENEPDAIDFTQNLKYSKQFSYKHTTTATVNHKYSKDKNYRNWSFNRPLFSGILPLVAEDETFELLQNTSSRLNKAALEIKHYWVLNNTNHIYPVVGVDFLNQEFTTLDAQILNSGEVNDFTEAGFNNDLDFRFMDQYFGFQYKKKLGDLIIKPGLFYHFYMWDINQLGEQITNKTKPVLLPELEGEYEIHNSEKVKLKYRLNSRFSDASTFANRLRLTSFNRLYQGNEDLENQLYHSASLSYYKFSLFKGVFINANFNYTNRLKSVRNTTIIDGIDQITTAIYTDLPEESFSLSGSFSKKVNDYKLTIQTNGNLSNYSRIINEEILDYESKNYGYTFKTETSFKDLPNIELGVEHRFNEFSNDNFNNSFEQINPYAILEYDFWNAFILKADYQYNYYENQNTGDINRFELGNFSLYYNKEDSPWGFEIAINNAFDVRYRRNNSFSQFIVTDQRIFIQPRTALLKISYKL
jgi:hypothetical protein